MRHTKRLPLKTGEALMFYSMSVCKEAIRMEIAKAQAGDVEGSMALGEAVRDGFPGLETPETMQVHRRTVLEFMTRGRRCARGHRGE